MFPITLSLTSLWQEELEAGLAGTEAAVPGSELRPDVPRPMGLDRLCTV